jgi:outer membrane protein assembly factor BamB
MILAFFLATAMAAMSGFGQAQDTTPPVISNLVVTSGGLTLAGLPKVEFTFSVSDTVAMTQLGISITARISSGSGTAGPVLHTVEESTPGRAFSISGSVAVLEMTGWRSTVEITVTARDIAGNLSPASTGSAEAVDTTPPTVDAGPDATLVCRADGILLQGSAAGGFAPYTYSWKDAQGTTLGENPQIRVMTEGDYTLVVTGANGAQDNDTTTVTYVPVTLSAYAGSDQTLACPPATAALSGRAVGGCPPYSLAWKDASGAVVAAAPSSSSGILDFTASSPGVFTFSATDRDAAIAEGSIVVDRPVTPLTVAPIPTASLTCSSSSAQLPGRASGGCPPYSLTWKNSAGAVIQAFTASSSGSLDATVNSADAYSFTAVDAAGLTATTTISVAENKAPPTLDLGGDRILSADSAKIDLAPTQLSGSEPFIYAWTNASGAAVGSGRIFEARDAGVYALTVTGSNGCSTRATVAVMRCPQNWPVSTYEGVPAAIPDLREEVMPGGPGAGRTLTQNPPAGSSLAGESGQLIMTLTDPAGRAATCAISLFLDKLAWPMAGSDGGWTGRTERHGLPDPWTVPIHRYQAGVGWGPLLIGRMGTLFFRAAEGLNPAQEKIVAFDPAARRVLWTAPVADKNFRPAIGPDGTVYVYGPQGGLQALDPATGRILWELGCDYSYGPVTADILVDKENRLYGTCGLATRAFGPPPGRGLMWTYKGYDLFHSAAGGGKLWLVEKKGVELVGSDGQRKWRADILTDASHWSRPMIDREGKIYLIAKLAPPAREARIIGLKPDGTTGWTQTLSEVEDFSHAALDADGRMLFLTRAVYHEGDILLRAIDSATGAVSWTKSLTEILSTGGVANAAAVVGGYPGIQHLKPMIDGAGVLYLHFNREPDREGDLLLIEGGRLKARIESAGFMFEFRGNLAMGPGGEVYYAASYKGPHSATGEHVIMATVPNVPPTCALTISSPTFRRKKDAAGKIVQEVVYEIRARVEDPLGETRELNVALDFGDGTRETQIMKTYLRSWGSGTYDAEIKKTHVYPEGQYRIGLQVNVVGHPSLGSTCGELATARDTTPPEVSLGGVVQPNLDASDKDSVSFNGTASDLESGVARVEWKIDNDPWQSADGTTNWKISVPTRVEDQQSRMFWVYIRAVDWSGNVTPPERWWKRQITIDRRHPEITDAFVCLAPPDGRAAFSTTKPTPFGRTPYLGETYGLATEIRNRQPERSFAISLGWKDTKTIYEPIDTSWYVSSWDVNPSALQTVPPLSTTIGPGATVWLVTARTRDWNWIPPHDWEDFILDLIFSYIPLAGDLYTLYQYREWAFTKHYAVMMVEWNSTAYQPSPNLGLLDHPIREYVEVADEKVESLQNSMLLSLAGSLATLVAEVTAFWNPAVAIVNAIIEAALTFGSHEAYLLAMDPAPDYQARVKPAAFSWPSISKMTAQEDRKAADAALEAAADIQAMRQSYARHLGAATAHNRAWAKLQAKDAAQFARRAEASYRTVHSWLETKAYPEVNNLDPSKKSDVAKRLEAWTMPTEEEKMLRELFKMPTADLSEIKKKHPKILKEVFQNPKAAIDASKHILKTLSSLAEKMEKLGK